MADLEEHAIKRDRGFLVRLVLVLLLGATAGAYIFSKLTSDEIGSCAARSFGTVAEPGVDAGAGAPATP